MGASDDIHVSFTRSGGFAGTIISGDLDSRELAPEESQTLRELVEAADFFAQPAVIEGTSGKPDRDLQWEVTVEAAAGRHTVRFIDGSEPAPMRELARFLLRALRRRARAGS
jgi:hypothetical protein